MKKRLPPHLRRVLLLLKRYKMLSGLELVDLGAANTTAASTARVRELRNEYGYPTREECVEAFLDEARKFFEREGAVGKTKAKARTKIVELLTAQGLFGWSEPIPEASA